MDPLSTALIAAISAGVVAGTSQVAQQAIVDAYRRLRESISQKLGGRSAVVEAIEKLEEAPTSEGRAIVLKEEIAASDLAKDEDITRLAKNIMVLLASDPNTEKHIQMAVGSYISQADRNSSASVNIESSDD